MKIPNYKPYPDNTVIRANVSGDKRYQVIGDPEVITNMSMIDGFDCNNDVSELLPDYLYTVDTYETLAKARRDNPDDIIGAGVVLHKQIKKTFGLVKSK